MPSVWVIGHDDEFVELAREVSREAGLTVEGMKPSEALARIVNEVPRGIMIDGSDTLVADGREFARRLLEHSERVVISTGRRSADLDPALVQHEKTRLMLKPFSLDSFVAALRWLSGHDDVGDEWFEAESGPR